jgi:CRP/FNR family transcriptional regulator
MNEKLWYIQQLDLFKGLAKDKLHKIESLFAMKEYGRREVIFEPGDKDKVFLVKTGQVELYQLTASGKKTIIERLRPGSLFGDLGSEGSAEIFVEATVDSYVCSLEKNNFFTLIAQYPDLSEKLMKQLFHRLTQVERRMSSVASDTAYQRIVKLLLNLGKKKRLAISRQNQLVWGGKARGSKCTIKFLKITHPK